jgi:hypothetical protein
MQGVTDFGIAVILWRWSKETINFKWPGPRYKFEDRIAAIIIIVIVFFFFFTIDIDIDVNIIANVIIVNKINT